MMPPNYAHPSWDKVVLAGVTSPGVVRLSGHERVTGWDVKDASGQDGGTTTRKGDPVGEFTAEFELSDDPAVTDFQDWDAFQALIESSVAGKEPVALPIYHPDLERNGYTAVVKRSIGECKPDGMGGGRIAVKFGEYRPPKPKASGTPKGTTDADKRVEDAEKALDEEIEAGEGLW